MGKALVACLLLAACQGMYVAKPAPLRDPPTIRPKPGAPVADDAPPYVEDCDVNFSGPATKQRHTPAAQKLVATGNASLSTASTTTASPAAAQAAIDAIAKYRQALQEDPYNAEATLKLALAYDRTLRKGCAIAMLKRLSALADSQIPTLKAEAKPNVELVRANSHWFRGYRVAAEKAAGL